MMKRTLLVASMVLAFAAGAIAAPIQPPAAWRPKAGDFTIRDFRFASGDRLPELRLHWLTLGTPRRDRAGHVVNAVLILHGTGGSGRQFLAPQFASELFGPGQLLDARRWYVILPDDIGHGGSSKPSDGLRSRFPHYRYADMVRAEHALVTEGLRVDHLHLIMGTSVGCMHAFLWGEAWPSMMDALMPLACLPTVIAGRNRVWREMIVRAIETDPAWRGGDYDKEPAAGLQTAADILAIAGSAPAQMQKTLPTAAAADAWLTDFLARVVPTLDADDLVWALDSSRDYDPAPKLSAIAARVLWINSADDFINPPELGLAPGLAKRLRNGRFVLLPIGPLTHGHGTHTWAAAWKPYLARLLAGTASAAP